MNASPRTLSGAARLAWALCALAAGLALAAIPLAAYNGENLIELVANHHAIGILDALVLPLVGALIVMGDRRHPLAWIMLADGLFLAVFNLASQYGPLALGLTSRHAALPGGAFAAWLTGWTNVPGIVIGVVVLTLLFPDGRLPSRRWWPLGLAAAVNVVVPTLVLAVGYWPLRGPAMISQEGAAPPLVNAMFGYAFIAALLLGALSVAALVVRFRRAGAVQRQQIKWFAYGSVLSIPMSIFPEARPWGPYLEFLGTVIQLAGLAIGILRFRLWDIDRLVNRTLVYGLLTVILGGGYALGVLVIGNALSAGREVPSIVVAATTLVVAALVQPLRRRLQGAVDRRFDRRHYDAARTIESFAGRLRTQTGLGALSGQLLAVVDETVQPTQASLWLRPPPGGGSW